MPQDTEITLRLYYARIMGYNQRKLIFVLSEIKVPITSISTNKLSSPRLVHSTNISFSFSSSFSSSQTTNNVSFIKTKNSKPRKFYLKQVKKIYPPIKHIHYNNNHKITKRR